MQSPLQSPNEFNNALRDATMPPLPALPPFPLPTPRRDVGRGLPDMPVHYARTSGRNRTVGLFALCIAIPLWLEGARYTRDGWIVFLNWICARLYLPFVIPTTFPWQVSIATIIALGVGYSYIELVRQPIRFPRNLRRDLFKPSAWWIEPSWYAWIVWIIIIITDIGTTYAGVRNPRPNELPVLRDIAAHELIATVYATIITFVPDRLARYGWHSVRRG